MVKGKKTAVRGRKQLFGGSKQDESRRRQQRAAPGAETFESWSESRVELMRQSVF